VNLRCYFNTYNKGYYYDLIDLVRVFFFVPAFTGCLFSDDNSNK